VSYDLDVYLPRTPDTGQLSDLISSIEGLAPGSPAGSSSVSVVRGAERAYCFTVSGPFRVEAEDVPHDVAAAVPGISAVYYVMVEGSAEAARPFAREFALRLAWVFGGAVLDQQAAEVWARGARRPATRPPDEERADVVELNWYVSSDSLAGNAGADYVRLSRQLLPEALPRRYGEFEPLQNKLADTGDPGFAKAWRAASSPLFFAANAPCLGGALHAGPGKGTARPVWKMSLDVHRQPLTETLWRDALRRLFIALAEDLHAFFASAEVTRGHIWNGRGMWPDGHTEVAVSPLRRDGWKGLPPYPVWWSWYGQPYLDLVHQELAGAHASGRGLYHQWGEEPLDREALSKLAAAKKLLGGGRDWIPPDLLVRILPGDGRVRPIPIEAAARIPDLSAR
jgi:hypothetical protein